MCPQMAGGRAPAPGAPRLEGLAFRSKNATAGIPRGVEEASRGQGGVSRADRPCGQGLSRSPLPGVLLLMECTVKCWVVMGVLVDTVARSTVLSKGRSGQRDCQTAFRSSGAHRDTGSAHLRMRTPQERWTERAGRSRRHPQPGGGGTARRNVSPCRLPDPLDLAIMEADISRRGRIVWSSARAWRARNPKGFVGSNPTLSASIPCRPQGVVPFHSFASCWVPCGGTP